MRFSQKMPKQIVIYFRHIKNSYWFIPTLMAILSVLFATLTLIVDYSNSATWLPKWAYLFSGGSDGARDVVGVIAGSIITVAGVTFSISIVILSLAAQQYGSRLLRNFTRDRSLHFIIGAFISTYVFCILILPSIHAANDLGRVEFIPRISVTICVAAAICDVFILIYFIHHVSQAIQAAFLTSSTQSELLETLDALYPDRERAESEETEDQTLKVCGNVHSVKAKRSGYLQNIDIVVLIAVADRLQATMKLLTKPGEYVVNGDAILQIFSDSPLKDKKLLDVEKSFAFGYQRTMDQDPGFGFDMLVEMGVRALSPGINDPFTAIQCIDHLREGLKILAERGSGDGYFRGKDGEVRVIFPFLDFKEGFERTAPVFEFYAKQSPTVLISLQKMLLKLEAEVSKDSDKYIIKNQLLSIDQSLVEVKWRP